MKEAKKRTKRANPQHSSESDRHFTPREIVAAARETLGDIDLDPASEPAANAMIRARRIFTREDNGLRQRWGGRVFLNPPGGVTAERASRARLWWFALASRYFARQITSAIFIGFNLEILQKTQSSEHAKRFPIPLDFPFCIPAERPDYLKPVVGPDGKTTLVPQGQPTHGGVVVFLPPRGPVFAESVEAFAKNFSPIGKVRT